MNIKIDSELTFTRLQSINPVEIIEHMSDPRLEEHMPLLTFKWDTEAVTKFIAVKEAHWQRDGLGHWAILENGSYVGWGGFQLEGDEWDFGLVLKPSSFGLGGRITKKALEFAKAYERIAFVTFLLPTSRTRTAALTKLGATLVGEVKYRGATFRKFRLIIS